MLKKLTAVLRKVKRGSFSSDKFLTQSVEGSARYFNTGMCYQMSQNETKPITEVNLSGNISDSFFGVSPLASPAPSAPAERGGHDWGLQRLEQWAGPKPSLYSFPRAFLLKTGRREMYLPSSASYILATSSGAPNSRNHTRAQQPPTPGERERHTAISVSGVPRILWANSYAYT